MTAENNVTNKTIISAVKDVMTLDDKQFNKVLKRSIVLPIVIGIASATLFVILILGLLRTMVWVGHTERVIGSANEVAKLASDMESSMRGFLITKNEEFLAPYRIARPSITNNIAALMTLVADNSSQTQRLKNIQVMQIEWNKYALEAIEARRNDLDYVALTRTGRGRVQFEALQEEIGAFINAERILLQERTAKSKSASDWVIGLYLSFMLIMSVYLVLSGRKDLLKLSADYGSALAEHNRYAAELEHQAWLRVGQAKLGEVSLGKSLPSDLSQAVLKFLNEYLAVSLGAFYTLQDKSVLTRTATFGFSKPALENKENIKLGEGLIGEAAASGKIVKLNDLPNEYFKINTSLGEITPKNIVIVPILNAKKISGVMELGFLNEIAPRDAELLQLLSPIIGSALEMTLARQREHISLLETQQLNEELQVQQEELRSINEELDEQSRALEESQINLENQKAELEQTNNQLTEQAEKLDKSNVDLQLSQQLLEARAADLERASKYKSEFLANMSHELRTPLNSSLILAKMLSENPAGNLTDEQVTFANTIYSSGNDLLNLINDILDISKVEAGKLDINLDSLSVKRMVETLSMIFTPLAQQKNLTLNVNMLTNTDKTIISDQQRLQQILKNLLSNAVKFTENGQVTLEVFNPTENSISFVVQDTGIGIEASDQESIFDVFTQVDSTINRRYAGSGLGLSISRELAKLLGGDITVSSEPKVGSKFVLTIPCDLSSSLESASEQKALTAANSMSQSLAPLDLDQPKHDSKNGAESSTGTVSQTNKKIAKSTAIGDDRSSLAQSVRTILIIEDDPSFAKILYNLGHHLKFQCLIAPAAEEGLTLAAQHLPDAILLDIRLPDQSGLSVLQQLKENPLTRHIPVHIISAEDHSEIALHLGAIGYELKPTSKEKLVQIFQRLEEKFTQKIKRVLLVEDDNTQRELLKALIADTDIEITAVASGTESLALLRENIFDCMIVDLKLPDMQGNELLEKMASEEICSFPPVIVYTGRDLSKAEELDLLKYSRSIIIKGARSPERLLDEVTLFLHKVESALPASQQKKLSAIRSRERIFDGRKVLLVDDDIRNVFALTSALEQKGFIVEVARNGIEAIQKVEEVSGIELVLMDIMMPEMDGLEATRRIRKNPRFKKLPIIAVTAKATKDDQDQCLAAGTNDYLSKPIDIGRLQSLLRVWMPTID